jgi:hypothetical protein
MGISLGIEVISKKDDSLQESQNKASSWLSGAEASGKSA